MSKNDKSYQNVIDIISQEQDWKAIVLEISKKFPQSVVDAANIASDKVPTNDAVRQDIVLQENALQVIDALLDARKRWVAIKMCRQLTKVGLKEAKEFCEQREAALGMR